jgi:hypothetical protein
MTAPAPTLRNGLQTVVSLALAQLADLWDLPITDLSVALLDVLPIAVNEFGIAAASMAADWYDDEREQAAIDGSFRAIVPALDLGGDVLAGWAAEPLSDPEPNLDIARFRVEGGLQKRMANAANLTMTTSAAEDPQARGYMRRTRSEACPFCRMVASRGGVYTKATSTFACHERCYCESVTVWDGHARPVGKYKPSDRPQSAEDRARVREWIAANLT